MATSGLLTIVDATAVDEVLMVRCLFEEYAASLGIDLCFQSFEQELAGLPGSYAPPEGRLLLAREDGQTAGCIALRPLEPGICEMKRLYVRPAFRAHGIGRVLVDRIVQEARQVGYRLMRLDTLPSMAAALALYRRLGFREIAPYYENPVEGAVFLELQLNRSVR
jgi:ribosomal protein S18 acetylase RimI-like enzyme